MLGGHQCHPGDDGELHEQTIGTRASVTVNAARSMSTYEARMPARTRRGRPDRVRSCSGSWRPNRRGGNKDAEHEHADQGRGIAGAPIGAITASEGITINASANTCRSARPVKGSPVCSSQAVLYDRRLVVRRNHHRAQRPPPGHGSTPRTRPRRRPGHFGMNTHFHET